MQDLVETGHRRVVEPVMVALAPAADTVDDELALNNALTPADPPPMDGADDG